MATSHLNATSVKRTQKPSVVQLIYGKEPK